MFKAFYWSRQWALWAYGGGVFLLESLYIQVYLTVLINKWYKGFYDILQFPMNHSVNDFWIEIYKFIWLAFPYVLLATITAYFTRLYAFRWRQAITFNYIPRWRKVTEEIEGASQRIQQDTERFSRIVETLGLQAVRAVMTLIAFIPILWALSSYIVIPWLSSIPGSLVWAAAATSIGGMAISWVVGVKLPGLEYNNQRVEAAYRKELVFGEDDKINHASEETLWELFLGLKRNYHRLFLHYGYFDVWINVYDQFMTIAPYLIMAPGMFMTIEMLLKTAPHLVVKGASIITLGLMVQVSNAFQRVHASFALFIHNWTVITELRSVKRRLTEFEQNIDKYTNN